MLNIDTFNKFIGHANTAHKQFCLWILINNKLANLNHWLAPNNKYKNFWEMTWLTFKHAQILSTARLFDPAYALFDKDKKKPRISLDYILTKLDNQDLSASIRNQQVQHDPVISSLRRVRDDIESHNSATFNGTAIINAGTDRLFQWLKDVVVSIKKSELHLTKLGDINIDFNMGFSQEGINKIFEDLLATDKNSSDKNI